MDKISEIKEDLPMSMAMAAFFGISWFIGAEINVSLFLLFKRRRGLYFWSCFLGCWGVILQPLFILLADFKIWTDLKGSITMIYLTWLIMVVPQSWVLYSRLHLVTHEVRMLKCLMATMVFNSIVFSVPTIVIGTIAQVPSTSPHLFHINMIWDRLQLTIFFAQETLLSILYIYQSRKYLRDRSLLFNSSYSFSSGFEGGKNYILHHLIYTNILIIALDCALLGIEYANLFYLQGAFKPCVYGIKLKLEFVILNRLVESVRTGGEANRNGSGEMLRLRSGGKTEVRQVGLERLETRGRLS